MQLEIEKEVAPLYATSSQDHRIIKS